MPLASIGSLAPSDGKLCGHVTMVIRTQGLAEGDQEYLGTGAAAGEYTDFFFNPLLKVA